MDDRTDKHSAKELRTNVQRTTVNIPISGAEKLLLLLLCVFKRAFENQPSIIVLAPVEQYYLMFGTD
jgi:hypothetical protein